VVLCELVFLLNWAKSKYGLNLVTRRVTRGRELRPAPDPIFSRVGFG
jgi:hypothetical protein